MADLDLERVAQAAPAYEMRLNRAEAITREYRSLRNEEARLADMIRSEIQFGENAAGRLDELRTRNKERGLRLEAAVDSLKKVVLENAEYCESQRATPIIFRYEGLSVETPFSRHCKLQSRRIQMQSDILRKLDDIRKLRKDVFCLDDKEADLMPLYEEFSVPVKEETEKADILRGYSSNRPNDVAASAVSRLTGLINSSLSTESEQIVVPKMRFLTPKAVELSNSVVPEFDVDVAATKDIQEKTVQAWKNVGLVSQAMKGSIDMSCLIYDVNALTARAQGTIDAVQEMGISELRSRGRLVVSKMSEMVASLNEFIAKIVRGYPKRVNVDPSVPSTVTRQVDVVSDAQIERCLELINSMEVSFERSQAFQVAFMEEAEDYVPAFRRLREGDAEMSFVIPEPVTLDDSEERRSFAELKNRIMAQQMEQLAELQAALESIPDSAKDVIVDVPEVYEQEKATYEVDHEDMRCLSFDVDWCGVTDAVSESNEFLLRRIQNMTPEPASSVGKHCSVARSTCGEAKRVIENVTRNIEPGQDQCDPDELNTRRLQLIDELVACRSSVEAARQDKVLREKLALEKRQKKEELERELSALKHKFEAEKVQCYDRAKSVKPRKQMRFEALKKGNANLKATLERERARKSQLQQEEQRIEALEQELEREQKEATLQFGGLL